MGQFHQVENGTNRVENRDNVNTFFLAFHNCSQVKIWNGLQWIEYLKNILETGRIAGRCKKIFDMGNGQEPGRIMGQGVRVPLNSDLMTI